MTLRAREHGRPSTLAKVIGQVRDAFGAMGDATPIMVGSAYRSQDGVGSGPRVLFVAEQRGRVGDPFKMGYACSVYHGCAVYVRAPETGDDITRHEMSELLTDRVLDCVSTAGTGHITWNDYEPDPPTENDAFGSEIMFTFTYRRDVRHDDTRWSLPPAAADTTLPQPVIPPGVAAIDATVDIIVLPKE